MPKSIQLIFSRAFRSWAKANTFVSSAKTLNVKALEPVDKSLL